MTDNVRALPGVTIKAERGVVDAEIVDVLEQLLADANSGALRCVAFAALTHDGMIKTHWVGKSANSNETHGAISLLAARFARARLDAQDMEDE